MRQPFCRVVAGFLTGLCQRLSVGTVETLTLTALLGDEGPESSPISITTHSEVTAPTLSLNVELLEFVLDWTSVQDVDTYRVYIDNVFLIEVASNTYTHTGTAGNENCFNVSAVNSFGTEGPLSNQECDTGS